MNCVTASEEGRGEGLGIPTAVVWQKTQRIFLEAIVMVLAGSDEEIWVLLFTFHVFVLPKLEFGEEKTAVTGCNSSATSKCLAIKLHVVAATVMHTIFHTLKCM